MRALIIFMALAGIGVGVWYFISSQDDGTAAPGVPASAISARKALLAALAGHPLAEALAIAAQNGYALRVIAQDGVALPITKDKNMHRINVGLSQGIVSKAWSIG